ncbi:hypothetical protein D3C71_1608330 [compost metagenome]
MVLVEPLECRLSKGIAGVYCRLELGHLASLYGIDPSRFLRLGRITRLARCSEAHFGIGAQGEFLLDPFDPELPEPSARTRS